MPAREPLIRAIRLPTMSPHDYTRVVFQELRAVEPSAVIELMNDPEVRRHLPLARGDFGTSDYERFLAAKERIWEERGYGPWAFVLDGEFVGWGGLQPEGEDVDVGLVLRRAHWGAGKVLYERIVGHAFEELGVESVITLLPPSRTRVAGLRRLGFRPDGEVLFGEEPFDRYRLDRCDHRGQGRSERGAR